MNEMRVKAPYEAPEAEEIVFVERWDVLNDPSVIAKPAEEEDWGDF